MRSSQVLHHIQPLPRMQPAWARLPDCARFTSNTCAGVALAGAHLAWQLGRVDLNNPGQCMATFASNTWTGAIIFGGCVAGRLLGA